MQIATFWQRFGAFWLDVLCLFPLSGLSIWLGSESRLFQLYFFLPGLAIGLWFHVYLVRRYGGTPGKLLLRLQIVKLDGTPVDYRQAFLRYVVMFALSAAGSVALIISTFQMTDAEYLSLDWRERSLRLDELAPSWYGTVKVMSDVWIWSEFLTMLTNESRRALHDFIAGTVVIRRASVPPSVKVVVAPSETRTEGRQLL